MNRIELRPLESIHLAPVELPDLGFFCHRTWFSSLRALRLLRQDLRGRKVSLSAGEKVQAPWIMEKPGSFEQMGNHRGKTYQTEWKIRVLVNGTWMKMVWMIQ